MKVSMFHLMPHRELPHDFEKKYDFEKCKFGKKRKKLWTNQFCHVICILIQNSTGNQGPLISQFG